MPFRRKPLLFSLTIALASSMFLACQQSGTTETNSNVNSSSVNDGNSAATSSPTQSANSSNATSSLSPSPESGAATVETHEPDKYQATLVFSAEQTGGERAGSKVPQIPVEVARDGANRRFAANLPVYGQVILLDRPDKRYLILPGRKEYLELTPDMTGFQVQRLMTPGQIISRLQQQQGFVRVGEEQVNGRTAIKYHYSGTAHTGTGAGDVVTDSDVFVDKETGLPLRSEINGVASNGVQGIKSGRVVEEIKNISTDVPSSLFDVPTNYSKLTPEQVKQQVAGLVAILQVLVNSVATSAGSPSPMTNLSPSPAG